MCGRKRKKKSSEREERECVDASILFRLCTGGAVVIFDLSFSVLGVWKYRQLSAFLSCRGSNLQLFALFINCDGE